MSKQNAILPDFLIIGAGKSGTTSLDSYLSQHPDIFMTPVKEPEFFAYLNHKAEDFDFPESKQFFLNAVRTFEDYYRLFDGALPNQIKGEKSNSYLYDEYSVDTIAKYVPNVKLIAIFRQPAERLYSRYLHLARENLLPTENFSECLNRETIWWQRPDLINEGFYNKHLSRFYKVFPKEQIKVYTFEELRQPKELFHSLFEFLGVDSTFIPKTKEVHNQSGFVKNPIINKIIGPNSQLIRPVKRIAPGLLNWAKDSNVIKKGVTSIRNANLHKPTFDPEIKRKLTDIYEEDIRSLEVLIEKDLSHWYSF